MKHIKPQSGLHIASWQPSRPLSPTLLLREFWGGTLEVKTDVTAQIVSEQNPEATLHTWSFLHELWVLEHGIFTKPSKTDLKNIILELSITKSLCAHKCCLVVCKVNRPPRTLGMLVLWWLEAQRDLAHTVGISQKMVPSTLWFPPTSHLSVGPRTSNQPQGKPGNAAGGLQQPSFGTYVLSSGLERDGILKST
jgi:hypothetical protein